MNSITEPRHRPLQIVHDIRALARDTGQVADGIANLKALGLGGIVTNVPFDDYLESDVNWRLLRETLLACKAQQMRVWIYDEKGYPSGYAGGVALRGRPELEAIGLFRNPENGEIEAARSYEGTHNCNSYSTSARTLNLLERAAADRFIEVTHERYFREIGEDLKIAEAFFTDEPALNVFYMPEIPGKENRPVLDPPDPNRPLHPGVPWSANLETAFRGRNLTGLFVDQPDSQSLRREFYRLVASELADSFFGGLKRWCASHGLSSSGHLLWEEAIDGHTPLYGNFLRCMMQLDITGIDILSAHPLGSYRGSRIAALYALSAAMLNGQRRIFTESSDHFERIAEDRIAAPREIRASLAWQAALGITEFTFYFSPAVRTADEYRQINDGIGELVAELLPCAPMADVFLYYPVELLQAAYRPVLHPWNKTEQSPELLRVARSFAAAVAGLLNRGVMPCLVDGDLLAEIANADPRYGARHAIRNARANAVVYPAGCRRRRIARPGSIATSSNTTLRFRKGCSSWVTPICLTTIPKSAQRE